MDGQNIYVDSNYAVRATGLNGCYIEEDGSCSKPEGDSDGFKYVPGDGNGKWDYQAKGIYGFLACPYNNGIYQVFVNSPEAKPARKQSRDDCVPFTAGAFEYDLPTTNATAAAWEY